MKKKLLPSLEELEELKDRHNKDGKPLSAPLHPKRGKASPAMERLDIFKDELLKARTQKPKVKLVAIKDRLYNDYGFEVSVQSIRKYCRDELGLSSEEKKDKRAKKTQ